MVVKIDKRNNKVVLSLGGNIGDVRETFIKTITALEDRVGGLYELSSLYKTKAWGVEDQPSFLNQVLVLNTDLSPIEVLNICLNIEEQQGRSRLSGEKWQERVIDIDVLFYENKIMDTTDLKIPHPYLHKRNFILFPLAEIIPDFRHPILGKTVLELKKHCKDNLHVFRCLD